MIGLRHRRAQIRRVAVVIGAALLGSCSQGRGPLKIVQFCVANAEGVAQFKTLLQSIAKDQGLRYIDSSGSTMRDLKEIGATGERMHTSGELINVGVEGLEGLGLSGGNMGLGPYEIAVGFSDQPDVRTAQKFADLVTSSLGRHWQLKTLPPNTGALPDPRCSVSSTPKGAT
jgi:hypothetical protein